MLPPETKAEIKRLFFAEHLTMNMIAEKLGVHHDTVKAAIEVERFHPKVVFRSSQMDVFVPFIIKTLEDFPKLRSTRLFQMLQDRGYRGSVQQLRRRVRDLRPKAVRAYLPQTVFAGEQAQVDWGHFGKLVVGKATRRLSCFVMVLAYSRMLYARFVFDQSMENFLQCHVNAFRAFSGVPRVLRYDNLKSAVIERFGQAIRFNPALLEMAGHYRFRPSACNPYSGHEKGRVERNVRYIRDNFFAGRHFASLADANAQLKAWLDGICNVRPWPDDKRRRVSEVFEEEKERLLPLPEHDYAIEHPRPVSSSKIPYIRFDLNSYSIPYKMVQKPLSLVVSEHLVRILDGKDEIARHVRSYDSGERIKCDEHFAGLYDQKPAAEVGDSRAFIVRAIPEAEKLFELMIAQGIPLGASTRRLLELLEEHGVTALRDAAKEAVRREIPRMAFLTMRLNERARSIKSPPPVPLVLPDRPGVRDITVEQHNLAGYDQLLGESDDDTNCRGGRDDHQ